MWCHEPDEGDPCDRTGCVAGGGLQQGGRRARRPRGAAAGVADSMGPLPVRRSDKSPFRPTPNAASSPCRWTTAKPDGDVAQLAMIRFKATGDKIGSLVINPGGPGRIRRRVGRQPGRHDAAVRARTLRPGRVRSARRRGAPRRRCGATPTPTTTGCGPILRSTTRQRASNTSTTRPRRSCSAASTRWARSSWPTSERPTSSRISTRSGPRSATTS